MFVFLLIDLFVFYFNHCRIPRGSFPQNFMKIRLDLAEILRIGKLDWKLFVCLYIFCFCFNQRQTPKGSFPQNFVKIRLDLAEILRIRKLDWKMFICLFVCLFVYRIVCFWFIHRRIPTGSFPQNFVKIWLDLAEIIRISKLDLHDRGGKKEWRNPTL